MEIRNALQKIENYLTVVSNLNKTILSEGTMSRDELLLMKKYLYTSIDRIEDIERLLIIDRKDEKSFSPTKNVVEDYVPPKTKEIVEVVENSHIEEVEAMLTKEEAMVEEEPVVEIKAEIVNEETETVGEIKNPGIVEEEIEEKKPEYWDTAEEQGEKIVQQVETPTLEILPVIENIITEDFALNELKETALPGEENIAEEIETVCEYPVVDIVAENKEEEKIEIPLINKVTEVETIATKFEEYKPATFAEELVNQKKEELSFFEQLNQKLDSTPQKQLFEMFDHNEEEFHETFSKEQSYEPINSNFKDMAHTYTNESVLVVEKKEEPIVEQLTPSSLNDVYKPQILVENVNARINKTFSESIALNDKFIFVRELFGNQFAEYENGLKQLDQQMSFPAAESYCKENLWNKFNWNDKTAAVERFMALLQKRFI